MSGPDQGRPAVPPVGVGQRPGWPVSPPPHRRLGPADPAEVGPYRLEAVLGAGGMGRVYLARTPAGSAVAVKVVHREYAGDASFRRRFEQEVAAARRVQGLYTVPVVDADLRADEPWLATAYVPGPSLQHAVGESGPLPAEAALGLVARVAEALQSIHAADVIHRDLKPSNIILTAEGPKVIDFGIARAADVTAVTATGMRTGTPAYMAPEYIRGQSVTEAGDVFALGVVAQFAATGRLAFGGGTDHSVVYRILEQAPDLDGCPEPLRTVAAGCLEKDPERRPTPAQVIEQCGRISANGTTHAATVVDMTPPEPGPAAPGRPPAPGTPGAGTLTAPSPAGSVPAPAGTEPPATPGSPDAGTPTRTAAAHDPAPGAASAAACDPAAPQGAGTLPHPPGPDSPSGPTRGQPVLIGVAGVAVIALVITLIVLSLPPSKPDTPALPYPSFAPEASLTTADRFHKAQGTAFSPDGKLLATGSDNLSPEGDSKFDLRLWNVAGHRPTASLNQRDEVGNEFGVRQVAFSPDGKLLAAGDETGKVGLWDVDRQRMIRYFGGIGDVNGVLFSPDGKTIISGDPAGEAYLWDVHSPKGEEGQRAYITQGHGVTGLALSPDGKLLAAAGDDPDSVYYTSKRDDIVVLWDITHVKDSHPPYTAIHAGSTVTGMSFSPDGGTLATSHRDGRVRLWDVADHRLKATISGRYGEPIQDVAFSPDGRTLAASVAPGVWLWDVASRKPRAILMSGAKDSNDVADEVVFSQDGRFIAGNDHERRTVHLWRTPK
ncbi:WD40 repeat domain-containing serine/threonine protein kinase [Streptomyces sp. TS71-3]|uniref:WD40 repeat domain-containing serine/threonine protein kinase n=1 Tax=Streptomyces sp. TS71-3 TaxID=2733862 RepID=UPI001B2CCEC0|nr:serine/threonine-protein kinase [Streptomyces sp. TS71-3]GHJ41675.1 protein kinase [Streptomyces sp. TS71-3]